ncbi:hypothetical protein cypCar_00023203 [Cyprinus carpio]|nr:hypothetical protein cypCar_00023203 [Cyprinus carpio]
MAVSQQQQQQQAVSKPAGGKHGNVLPLWGNEKTMNLNPMILTNVLSSPYFKVQLYELKTYHEVVDEIYFKVNHMEPWEKGSRKTAGQTGMCGGVRGVGTGGIVSTAFCLLYKLFTLKLTRKQVMGLITHTDSPYIRSLGFMYIRYTQPPSDLVDWYDEFLDDEEELDVKAGGGCVMTIGEMLRSFLTKLEWFSTLFPRIPVPAQKAIDQHMKSRPRKPPQKDEQDEEEAADSGRHGDRRRSRYIRLAMTPRKSPSPRRSQNRSRSRSHHREKQSASFDRELERERDRQRKEREGKDRDRERDRDRDRDRRRSRTPDRTRERRRSRSASREKRKERDAESERERSRRKDREHHKDHERSKDKRSKGEGEERRHKEDKEDRKHREEKRSKRSRSRSRDRKHKTERSSKKRSRSGSRSRQEAGEERNRKRERSHSKERSHKRSRSKERSHRRESSNGREHVKHERPSPEKGERTNSVRVESP